MSRKNLVYLNDKQLLEIVNDNPGITVKDIADLTKASKPSINAYLLRLINDEKIERKEFGKNSYSYYIKNGVKTPEVMATKEVQVEPVAHNHLDMLINNLAYQIADSIITKVRSKLYRDIPELKPTLELPSHAEVLARLNKPKEEKQEKLKVLVLNLLPQQAGLIQSELHDCLNIEFWNDKTGDGIEKLKSLSKWSDMVFIHTKHAAHNHQEVVKSVGADFILVPGGISQMQEALTKFFIEGKSE